VEEMSNDDEDERKLLLERGKRMLGWYYLWGGRSAFMSSLWHSKSQLTGADCSGLQKAYEFYRHYNIIFAYPPSLGFVGILYRSIGRLLPRDAHPMFIGSKNVSSPSFLQPGDLFFFSEHKQPPYM